MGGQAAREKIATADIPEGCPFEYGIAIVWITRPHASPGGRFMKTKFQGIHGAP
jgi:hypothetical protein